MTNAETTGHDTDEAPPEEVLEEAPEDTADTADTATDDADAGTVVDSEDRLVVEGEIAGDYLEELLDLLDFDGDIDLDVEGSRAVVSIDGSDDLNKLVGRKGEVLDALAGTDPAGGAPEDRGTQPADARYRKLAPPPPGRVGGVGRQGCQESTGKWRARRTRSDDAI